MPTTRIHEPEGRDAVGQAAATAFVGIDVSKATLDACLLRPRGKERAATFANDPAGHAALIGWADRHAAGADRHFCLEATGPYSEAIATALAEAGRLVSVANPARVKAHAAAAGQANKTDPADAHAIAGFARDRRPPAWQPPPPEVRELQGLVRRRDDLREMAAREKGRLDSPALTRAARKSVERVVKLLGREADRLQAAADALVAACPPLKADRDLLESIPGVGRQTATTVLAELPPVERLPSAQSAAAYCGLAPREFRSGASVRKRIRLSKAGNARLRKALYLPTLTAIRFNPLLKGFFERLVAAGKARMAAVGAYMRKLLMLCYGVLKSRTPFDPSWALKPPLDNTPSGSAVPGFAALRRWLRPRIHRNMPRTRCGERRAIPPSPPLAQFESDHPRHEVEFAGPSVAHRDRIQPHPALGDDDVLVPHGLRDRIMHGRLQGDGVGRDVSHS
jgi:transposase